MGVYEELQEKTPNELRKFAYRQGIKTFGLPRKRLLSHIAKEMRKREELGDEKSNGK